MDQVKNFAKVTVNQGYSSTDTSIVLSSGHGGRLPDPASGEFNLTWWNSTDYNDAADDPEREIVRCTARSSDTLTVTRGQESISATVKNISGKTYKMTLSDTKKRQDDIETEFAKEASTTQKGKIELATNAEVLAMADSARAVTPSRLAHIGMLTGWIPTADTWIYVSATTFKIEGADRTAVFTKGTKLKLTNNSVTKRPYVVSSSFAASDTTVTIAGEVDLHDSAISDPHYSYADCPQGFKRGQDWYRALVYLGTQMTNIIEATNTIVEFDTEVYDTNSNFNVSTYTYTVPISGVYLLIANISYSAGLGANSVAYCQFRVDGSAISSAIALSAYATRMVIPHSTPRYLTKGQAVTLNAYVNDVGDNTADIDDGLNLTSLAIQFIGI